MIIIIQKNRFYKFLVLSSIVIITSQFLFQQSYAEFSDLSTNKFISSNGSIEYKFPEGWNISNSNDFHIATLDNNTNDQIEATISLGEFNHSKFMQSAENNTQSDNKTNDTDCSNISASYTTINGMSAYQTLDECVGNYYLKSKIYMFLTSNEVISISYSATSAALYDQYLPLFDESLKTLRIDDVKEFKTALSEYHSSNFILIPSWVKNNAKLWSEGSVNDTEFLQGIQYLITNGIMHIPDVSSNTNSSENIPGWIKKDAEWWASNQISDEEFVKGIQFLIINGIIKL